ncbi:MAG: hypothetical protein Q9218_001302 [Villophora microphyllina]
MVFLSITQAMVDGITCLRRFQNDLSELDCDYMRQELPEPTIGCPITHAQVITLSKLLKNVHNIYQEPQAQYHLNDLLRGSKIHNEPTKPKAEQTTQYKVLMARLRSEEEARAYERMIHPPLSKETFEQRFPNSANSKLFADHQAQVDPDDETTYADVNRQMALILNILLSIVACSVALWLVASSWSVPRRLALSMGGSILVAVAEAVVYAGYLGRVREAREKGKKQIEIKEIIKTWVIRDDEGQEKERNSANMDSLPQYGSTPNMETLQGSTRGEETNIIDAPALERSVRPSKHGGSARAGDVIVEKVLLDMTTLGYGSIE